MVVLSVGTEPPKEAQALAQAMGIELNPFGFCMTDKFTPLETSQPGVFVCGTFSSPKEIAETIIDAAGAAGAVMQLMHDDLNVAPSSREYPFLARANEFAPERDVTNEPVRTGVFLCRCEPTIDGVVNTKAVADSAWNLPDVVHVERLDYACFPEAQCYIKNAIAERDLNRVVMAGCSHRTHESLYQRVVREAGLNPYYMEMVNLREQCAWVHINEPDKGDAQSQRTGADGGGARGDDAPVHKELVKPCNAGAGVGRRRGGHDGGAHDCRRGL